MKKPLLALAFVSAVSALPAIGYAESPSVTYNLGAVSEYRYRGISQSRLKPALQGGADYAHPSGFYVGTWASTIKWIEDAGTIGAVDTGNASIEWDIYAGYKGEVTQGLGFDVGALAYIYPGNDYDRIAGSANADTGELYGALTFGPVTAKYSHAVTNLFGFGNSKRSGYLDLSATFDLGNGWSLTPHLGRQNIKNNTAFSYTDYSLTLTKDLGKGFTVSAAAVGTDTKNVAANPNGYAYYSPGNKNLGRDTVVVGLKYSF